MHSIEVISRFQSFRDSLTIKSGLLTTLQITVQLGKEADYVPSVQWGLTVSEHMDFGVTVAKNYLKNPFRPSGSVSGIASDDPWNRSGTHFPVPSLVMSLPFGVFDTVENQYSPS